MKILYFTSTGNSLYIAKSLGGELLSIPQMIKEGRYEFEDEKIGLVFPTYSISVPPYIKNFLRKSKFKSDYIFGVMTYGIYSGAATEHLMKIGKEINIEFAYTNVIKMVDAWLIGFNMKKQIETAPKKRIEEHLAVIKNDINNSKRSLLQSNILGKIMTGFWAWRGEKPNPKGTLTGNTIGEGIKNNVIVSGCKQLGICTKVCPMKNITLDKETGVLTYGNNCLSCCCCVQNCPANALHLKSERSTDRFRNKHVTLAEIIQSNN